MVFVSVAAGGYHTCLLKESSNTPHVNVTGCFGVNTLGELGLGITSITHGTSKLGMGPPIPLAKLGLSESETIISISAGLNFTCAVIVVGGEGDGDDDDNTRQVKCFGSNNYAQLGLGSSLISYGSTINTIGNELPFVNIGESVNEISCGGYHTCALLINQTVKCWGSNSFGQLGLGISTNIIGNSQLQMGNELKILNLGSIKNNPLLVVKIATGVFHTCTILISSPLNILKCFGSNEYAQLGLGITTPFIGTGSKDMGNNLPAVNLGFTQSVVDVSLGYDHSCATNSELVVKCWGANNAGQLGRTDTNGLVGSYSNEMGTNLISVDLGTNVGSVKLALGFQLSCSLTTTKQVKCWGSNRDSTGNVVGSLGQATTTYRIPSSPSDEYNSADNSDNYPMSDLPFVEIGNGLTVNDISVGCDGSTVCVVLSNHVVKCWGRNTEGEIGICSAINVGDTLDSMGNNLKVSGVC